MSIEISSAMRNILDRQAAVKFDHPINTNIASLGMAIVELNAAKTLTTDSKVLSALTKITQYLSWYKTVGFGGEGLALGKQSQLPNLPEMKAVVETGLFGKSFILTLIPILGLNSLIPQLTVVLNKSQPTE